MSPQPEQSRDSHAPQLTELLRQMQQGDRDAGEMAVGLVYQELRRIASRQLRREAPGHTLQRGLSSFFRADRGNSDGMLLMGEIYSLGNGAPKDDAAAVYWFTKASDGGDADAKFNLGEAYSQGLGVSKDLAKASQYYREASKFGNEDATRRLQQMSVGH